MQRKLYTEFDLLFDFISASVLGPGNMVFIFQFFWVGYEFSSGAFGIFLIHLAVMILISISLADQMYLCIKALEWT